MKIRITSSDDGDFTWRDYWEREALVRSFIDLGHVIVYKNTDIDILLYGHPHIKTEVDSWTDRKQKFAWFISHPEMVLQEDWSTYDYVWSCNSYLTTLLKAPNKGVILEGTMHKFRPRTEPTVRDIIMLGNWKPPRPEVITLLVNAGYKLGLAGDIINYIAPGVLARTDFLGTWLPNEKIIEFYNSGKLYVRIDDQDMREYGMISQNPVEVLVNSEALMIHETNMGLDEMSPSVPTFKDWQTDLVPLVKKYLSDDGLRDDLTKQCRKEAKHLTSLRCAKEMETYFD